MACYVNRIISELVHCVQTEEALERGEPPPAYAAAPPPPAPVHPKPLNPSASAAKSAPASDEALELVATRIASNLLLQAKMPNARLLSPAETPDFLKGHGVAWTSDIGVVSVVLLPPAAGKDAQEVASAAITGDAGACKADFASGRSSELVDDVVVTKAFTGCKDSSGSRLVNYIILSRGSTGYVVYRIAENPNSAASPADVPKKDANFQTAAVKAAFSP